MNIESVRERHVRTRARTQCLYFAVGWLLAATGVLGAYCAMLISGQSWITNFGVRLSYMLSALI